MNLATAIQSFFVRYLPKIKGVSPYTAKAYKETFALFIPFTANYLSKNINNLTLNDISFDLILAFLEYLEQNRKNCPNTRNQRLAALKSFAKMIRLPYPENKNMAEKILNIPKKRAQKKLIGFLDHEEVLKVLGMVNLKTQQGFRDYSILHLLYDSGARASEIASLKPDILILKNTVQDYLKML